jgi:hypothetical protein
MNLEREFDRQLYFGRSRAAEVAASTGEYAARKSAD